MINEKTLKPNQKYFGPFFDNCIYNYNNTKFNIKPRISYLGFQMKSEFLWNILQNIAKKRISKFLTECNTGKDALNLAFNQNYNA